MSSERNPPAPPRTMSTVTPAAAGAYFRRIRGGAVSDVPAQGFDDRPKSADLLRNYGGFLRSAGRLDDAEAAYRAAIATDPQNATAYYNLATVLADRDDVDGAAIAYKNAVALRPRYFEAWRGLGTALVQLRQFDEAREAFAAAAFVGPAGADVLNDLGKTLMLLGRSGEAEDCFRHAIGIDPSTTEGHGSLGALLMSAGRLVAAESMTRRARAAAPGERRWLLNLAVIERDLCRFDEAERLLRRALAADPGDVAAHVELLLCLNYHPDRKADEIFTEYRRFEARHAPRESAARPSFPNDATPDRRLRLAVFCAAPELAEMDRFALPLLEKLDRAKFELFGYGDAASPGALDGAPAPLDHWRPTVGLSDDAVADAVRRDSIDVMIDFGGLGSGRLLALARKPAPVQITFPLSTGYTSGIAAMDAFLADEMLVPTGMESLFAEEIFRIGRTPFCWRPPLGLPDVAPLPCAGKGYLTFGYLGPTANLNGRTIRVWAGILKRLPSSRLLLGAKPFEESAFRDLVTSRFAAEGVRPDRLEMISVWTEPMRLAAYADIDIALDPFPHSALVQAVEALWMGVPVVNLAERPSVGRTTASALVSAKLGDWVAFTPAGYVNLAVAGGRDVARLAALRSGLRDHVAASPIGDPAGLARAVEKAVFALWGGWCRRRFSSAGRKKPAERAPTRSPAPTAPVASAPIAWPVLVGTGPAMMPTAPLAQQAPTPAPPVATAPPEPPAAASRGNVRIVL